MLTNPSPLEPDTPPEQEFAELDDVSDLQPEDIEAAAPGFEVDPEGLVPREIRSLGARRFPFSTRQWVLLGVIAFFEAIVLIIFAILVISDTLY